MSPEPRRRPLDVLDRNFRQRVREWVRVTEVLQHQRREPPGGQQAAGREMWSPTRSVEMDDRRCGFLTRRDEELTDESVVGDGSPFDVGVEQSSRRRLLGYRFAVDFHDERDVVGRLVRHEQRIRGKRSVRVCAVGSHRPEHPHRVHTFVRVVGRSLVGERDSAVGIGFESGVRYPLGAVPRPSARPDVQRRLWFGPIDFDAHQLVGERRRRGGDRRLRLPGTTARGREESDTAYRRE